MLSFSFLLFLLLSRPAQQRALAGDPLDVKGHILLDQAADGEILEATGKIVRTQKDLASEKTIDEEQL